MSATTTAVLPDPVHSFEIAIALAGVRAADTARGHRDWLDWASDTGFRSVALDAAAPGLRPRDLDRSARRDIVASLRRRGLAFAGLDLWIPPEHFADPQRLDRALAATTAALDMAGELAQLEGAGRPGVVSVSLHAETSPEAVRALAGAAERAGAVLADHALPVRGAAPETIGAGIDPAALLLRGEDPSSLVSGAGRRIVLARLSDATDVGRVRLGAGRLDTLAYAVSLQTAGVRGPLVVEVRGLGDPVAGAEHAAEMLHLRRAGG